MQEAEVDGSSKRNYNITSLQRGLHLLELFAKADKGLNATEVAGLCGFPVSTVHRFLVNLESSGFLNREENGSYHLGVACVSLGQSALGQLDIRRLSRPFLTELNHRTRETVHLTVRFGLTAVYVEKLDSPEPLRIHSRLGAAVPLYCSAVGKVLLAYLPEHEQAKVLEQLELKRFTANTVGSLQELHAQLRQVRKNGYACDLEEHESHIRCIAAPIWDHSGAVHASLSITGPDVRMTVARLRQLAPLMQDVGLRISRELGYAGAAKLSVSAAAPRRSGRQPRVVGKSMREAARK